MATIDPRRRRRTTTRRASYAVEDVTRAFGPWLVQDAGEGDELRMFCPRCEDPATSHSPSASINPAEGVWNCLKSDEDGGSIEALVKELGLSIRPRRRVTASAEPPTRAPLENQDAPYEWADALSRADSPQAVKVRDYLDSRGIGAAIRERAHVGVSGDRVTFPMRRAAANPWLQTKFIRYTPSGKSVEQTPGAEAMPWPAEWLDEHPTLPVLLTEGEGDCLLAMQESDGQYVAVAVTGGAGTVPRDLSKLAGREVYVAFDLDDAGRKGMDKMVAALGKAGARAAALDLARLGVSGRGADLSDYFRAFGGTAAKLTAELERLRALGPDDDGLVAALADLMVQGDESAVQDFLPDMLTDEQIGELDPPAWTVHGWALIDNYTSIYGEPGVMKTFAILDLLRSVRAGVPWLGNPTVRGATLLFEGEGLTQLQPRIAAWNAYQELSPADLAPGLSGAVSIDLSTPEGVARVVRTVRSAEARWGERVRVVAFDPAVEFMPNEDVETMDLFTRGVRALARYLHVAVVVGHHSNAAGERARGGDQMRMRAGVHVRMERIDPERGVVGVVQEKNRFAAPLAMEVAPLAVEDSLVLSMEARMSRAEYAAARASAERTSGVERQRARVRELVVANQSDNDRVVLDYLRGNPWQSGRKVRAFTAGKGIGTDATGNTLESLAVRGLVVTRPAPRNATEYALPEDVTA